MKSLRLLAGFALVALMAISALYWLGHPEPEPQLFAAGPTPEPEEALVSKTDPGWFQQWFDMRKNEQGIIPRGLHAQWAAHDAENRSSRSSGLGSVTEVGPFSVGGRTRALMVDASNSSRYFAGGISGGLWVSNNSGSSWTAVNDQASNLSVSGITQNPFNSNVIYYCTGEGSGNSTGIPGEGIFKSTDGGNSFSLLSATDNGNFDYAWKIAHSRTVNNLVVVATDTRGIWRTTDGGSSWNQEFSTTREVNDLIAMPNGHFFATINREGIYRSTNNGDSWTEITSGLPSTGFQRIAIAFSENNPNTLYAAYAQSNDVLLGIYKSTNGGTSWALTSGQPPTSSNFTWYCFYIGVSANNADRVIYGAQNTYFSTNGGDSWSFTNGGHADYHSFANDPANANNLLLGNDGGVYRKSWTSMGSSPVDLNSGYHVTQFYAGDYFPTGNSVMGGTQDNGTHRAINLGWTDVFGGDGGYSQVSLQNANLGYLETQNGRIRRSTNLQSSNPTASSIYTQITNEDNTLFIAPFEINRKDGEQVYFCSRNRIWRTTNRGNDWDAITTAHQIIFGVGVSKDPDPTVFFGGSFANFYRIDNATSADAGDEVDLSGSVPGGITQHVISDIKPHPFDNTKVYVTFSTIASQGRVWRVDNVHTNNPTWVNISSNLPSQLPCNSMEVHPLNDQVLYVGTDFGLYCSMNGGDSWSKESGIPNVAVYQVQLRESDNKLFLFTHGRGAWAATTTGVDQQYADFPYSTGFETGFDHYWSTNSTSDRGRIKITTDNGPNTGSQHMTMDASSSGGQLNNRADLHIDLSGESDVELRFWWKEFSDENHSQDGIYFSDNGGSSFTKVHSLNNGPSTYTEVVLDVDDLADNNGLNLNGNFVIRFQHRDNYPIASDGFAFDDISVGTSGAKVPYFTGFEGGLDEYWNTSSTASRGRVQVTSANGPHTGSDHLTMDVTSNGSSVTNFADLHINLAGESEVELRFWWKEFNDENHGQDAIYFSDNGGNNFKKVHTLNNGPSTYT
ncbi:MAG: hypothetical protein AAGB22_02560, partial [Bacteroidota bacterium]